MWTKIGMAAMLAVLLASTADLGYAQAADGRATDGGRSLRPTVLFYLLSRRNATGERSVAHPPQFSSVKLIGRMIARRAPRPVPAAIVSAPMRARSVVAVPVRNAMAPPVRMPTPSAAPRGLNNVRGPRSNRSRHNRSGVRGTHRGGQAESANQR